MGRTSLIIGSKKDLNSWSMQVFKIAQMWLFNYMNLICVIWGGVIYFLLMYNNTNEVTLAIDYGIFNNIL